MQIPKFLLMFCVAALGLSTLQAQRVDTEEQAKARELLRKKMAELDVQPPVVQPQQISKPAPEPAAPPKKPKAQKAAPKSAPAVAPVATPPPVVIVPPPPARVTPHALSPAFSPANTALVEGTAPLSPEAEAKAREELRRKIAESSPSKSTPRLATTPPAPKAPAKPVAASATEKKSEQKVVVTPAPTVTSKKQKKSEQYVFDTPAPTARVESPIPAAVSGSKNQKLAELLTLYRSNAITPEEYHKQRAAILAQP